MTRLEDALREHKPAFVPYLMAGDPDLETTEKMLCALARAGAAAIELGIPYGDPLADGPTIAAAAQRALARGVTTRDVLELTKRVGAEVPIVLFTYFNPVYKYGIEHFAADAASARASGVIVPDLTLEEIDALQPTLEKHGLAMPLLVAPTTPPSRAAQIAQRASGFVYVVSRLGVTGAGSAPDLGPLREQIAVLRAATKKPLAVGFGISTTQQFHAVAPLVDGIIVGSALIDAYAGATGKDAVHRVEQFVRVLL